MKNIFVATDFSDAAVNAGKYAAELARHFKANVFLFNGYNSPVEIPESYFFFTMEQVGEQVMEQLEKEERVINKYGLVNVEKIARSGTDAATILLEAKNKKADLLICGMKGEGKMARRIFGSMAISLVRKTTIPLLIVPEDASFRLPNNVLFASDVKTIPNAQNIRMLKEIGQEFGSKLAVVTVINGDWNEGLSFREHYADFIADLSCMQPSLESLHGSDICAELEKYVKEHFINMVAIVPHDHGFLERIFAGSITKQMTFLTKVPLLILPEKTESMVEPDKKSMKANNS